VTPAPSIIAEISDAVLDAEVLEARADELDAIARNPGLPYAKQLELAIAAAQLRCLASEDGHRDIKPANRARC